MVLYFAGDDLCQCTNQSIGVISIPNNDTKNCSFEMFKSTWIFCCVHLLSRISRSMFKVYDRSGKTTEHHNLLQHAVTNHQPKNLQQQGQQTHKNNHGRTK